MIFVDAVIFLVILALLFRRDLATLSRLDYRGGWKLALMVLGLFILQAALIIYVPRQTMFQIVVLILSQLALIFLLLLNRHLPGIKLFVLGVVLNTVVMVANGGWMPMTPDTYHFAHPDRKAEIYAKPGGSKNIVLSRSETRLWVLSDIIPVNLPWRRNVVSIGDLCLVLGAAQFIFLGTQKRGEKLVDLRDISPT